MSRSRTRRTLPSLHTEELAIIAPVDMHGETAVAAKCYAMAFGVSSKSMYILTEKRVPLGELLDISISLQGQNEAHSLKGVARTIAACDHQPGYVVGVELVPEDQAGRWRHQFH
jgi:hypothetical protein